MNILYVIPARGGSKGIRRKNLHQLLGKPLIGWTIDAVFGSHYRGRVVVSSDDLEILAYANLRGVECPFVRPSHLATDSAETSDVLKHACDYYIEEIGYKVDAVVCLQPTSPLRTSEDIDSAIDMYVQNPKQSVVSLTEAKEYPVLMRLVRDGLVVPYDAKMAGVGRRQEYEPIYVLNGAIYVTPCNVLMSGKILAEETRPYIMPRERSIDVDSYEDIRLAEYLLRNVSR